METSKFEISDYLYSEEMITEYFNTVLEEGNTADVINAIEHLSKGRAMTKISGCG
jgi:DNA-binding phage protein